MPNFYLDDNADENFFPTTNLAKIENNIKIIKLAKQLTKDKQKADLPEQKVLAKYVGWGGLANEFFDEYNPKFKSQREELKEIVSKDEYEAMRASSLTAYYTNPAIARAMWQKIVGDGFTHGNVLDPSMGTGIFFMTMPEKLRNHTKLYGIELDPITGMIAKLLFPDAKILVKGFEDVDFLGQSDIDLTITNVPFGDTRLLDKDGKKSYYIHDYFLKKSLEVTRDLGIVAIITSTGLTDKRAGNILQSIKGTTDFLGGVRLPSSAFKQIAGTTVTTDILFFQKDINRDNLNNFNDEAFKPVQPYPADKRVFVNPYFLNHPEQILGFIQIQNYHGATLTVVGNGDLISKLHKALQNVSAISNLDDFKFYGAEVHLDVPTLDDSSLPKPTLKIPEYEFDYVGNDVYYRYPEQIVKDGKPASYAYYVDAEGKFAGTSESKSKTEDYDKMTDKGKKRIFDRYVRKTANKRGRFADCYKHVDFYYTSYSQTEINRIEGLVDIKKDYLKLIHIQLRPHYDHTQFNRLLAQLNADYDYFKIHFGVINSAANRRLFKTDNRYPLIGSLEDHVINDVTGKYEYVKSDAFFKPLVSPERKILKVDTALDALLTSVSEARGVDFTFMQAIYPGHSKEDIIKELGDNIVYDPDLYLGSHKHKLIFVTKDQFLSGDVVTKRDELQQLVTEKDKKANWSHYLEMIKKVIPKPLTVADISFKLSSNWIPDTVLSSFLVHYFKYDNNVDFDWSQNLIMHSPKGRSIQRNAYAYMSWSEAATQNKYTVQNNGEIVAPYTDAIYIIDYLLNSKQPTISTKVGEDKKGKPIYRPNAVLTAQLREVEARIEKLFHDYIMNNDSLVKVIEDSYNNLYNRIVNKKYDGSHLHISGLSKAYHLRDYQANAVERIIETGRALLAHEVGTGKTLTMISAGFKLKELGLIHRPLYVVPTNLVGQFGQDILKFYPTKKVLITSRQDFQKQNRKRFFARFITGDYDAIVIGHSQFEKIQVSPENKKIFLKDALDKLSGQIDQMNSQGTFQNYTVKELERRKKGLAKHLKAQQDLHLRQDTFMNFEELGIDFLFVDEAHNFKNIAPNTSLGQIKGINQSTSKKALDMRMKVRLMQKRFDNKHVVFSTGTPVSNSISELWTMMSYIQPDVLKRFQIDNFDNWVGNFGLIETVLELNTTGNKYQARKRFVKFVNLPELMHIYRITADVKMADQTSLERPRAKKFVIKSELTPAQKDKLQELIDRTDAIKDRAVTPDKDNMLKITNEARKMTLDMRLFNTSLVKYTAEDSEKLGQVADNVFRIWKRTTPNKGTQIIFSDLGTPKAKTDFDVYNAISDLLQKRGIPKREIAFMHQANTAEAKLELSRKVNAGQIRVVIGSTQKGGTGLNIQRRMKAAHHLDVPWRPSDIIQRNGRLVRQGNMYREVEIYHYITKGSFDNYLWQIQENKLKYITQIMTSNSPIRAMHDVDSETMTASDFKAIATQNPYLKLKMQIDNQLVLLRNEKNSFVRNYRANVIDRQKDKEYLPVLKDQIKNLKSDLDTVKPYLATLKGTDIEMASGQKLYSNGALLNSRLHKEVENIVFGSSEQKGTLKTIGKIAGLNIQAQYDTYDITKRYYRKTFWADLWLVGKGSYKVELNLSLDSSNYPVKIKNAVEKLPDELNKEQDRLRELQTRLKRDLGSKEFSKQLQIDYLSEKKSVLDPLIEGDSKVEIIKAKMTKFDSNFKLVHPNFVLQTDENKEKLTKVKYQNDPNDYDDSLFEDVKNKLIAQNQAKVVKTVSPVSEVHTIDKKTRKQTVQPQPVKTITPVSHQSQTDGQSTQLSLFDLPSDNKDTDEEDADNDKPIIGTVQTSLF